MDPKEREKERREENTGFYVVQISEKLANAKRKLAVLGFLMFQLAENLHL